MPDINKLVPRALATGTAAVAIGSTVKSIADDLKQAQARNANTVAAAGGATLTKTLTSKKKDDIQERVIRSKAQTARKTLGYPLDESPFEICFHFIKYQPGNNDSSGRRVSMIETTDKKKVDEIRKLFNASVFLPIPNNLIDSTSLSYDNLDMGNFQGPIVAGITDAVVGAANAGTLEAAAVAAGKAVSSTISQFRTQTSSVALIEAAIRSNIPARDIAGVVSQVRGNVINPQRTVQFNGVNLRTHEYSWRFSPNSPEESKTIRDIVTLFKTRALPERKDEYFLNYPDLVFIEFIGLSKKLYHHRICLIESINVNYAPSGQPAFFAGTDEPVEIEMSVKLLETSINTRESYDEDTGENK